MMFSAEAEYRHKMVSASKARLEHLAYRALHVFGKKNTEIVAVCIEVDDPRWGHIVQELMPAEDWDVFRNPGLDPIALGTAMWSICNYLAEEMPEIAGIILEAPPEGIVTLIALGKQGCTVYDINPSRI